VPPGVQGAAPYGISKATGLPYRRKCGAYQSWLMHVIDDAVNESAAPEGTTLSSDERTELQRLRSRSENATLTAKIDMLTEGKGADIKMAELATKAEMAEKLLAQFQAGLEKGIAMASGMRISLLLCRLCTQGL